MKKIIWALAMCTINWCMGQSLTGKVVAKDGDPLENVAIFNKINGEHSHSDALGHFVLNNTQVKDTIYFSHIGYATKTWVVAQEHLDGNLTIELEAVAFSLDQITVVSEVNTLNRLVDVDVKMNPIQSSQEVLRKVPGLFIGQHAGGGKAEQIFLRGFDIDHGTDVAIDVEDMPVNMVSHAHGQGYADLHFVIPETIDNVNFGLGPFYANKGDFNTAGYVNLGLKKRLDENLASVEVGKFNTRRLLLLTEVMEKENSSAYIASEFYLTDGPFEASQNFNRLNLLGRYVHTTPEGEELVLTGSHFQSKWDASGQIPQRAVDQGLIGRFGAIDSTEGGETHRTNVMVTYRKALSAGKSIKTNAFLSHYGFELFSNFTFFLEDPVNGDQIMQYEDRMLMGMKTVFEDVQARIGSTNFSYRTGVGFRYDNIDDNELSRTLNRQTTLEQLAYGNVDETNAYAFLDAKFKWGRFMLNPALRMDYFKFDYWDRLSENYDSRSEEQLFFSPKLNTVYHLNDKAQIFLKTGIGFHSNDARVVVANEGNEILPAAYGVDLGGMVKLADRWIFNTTLWSLFLEQEFVYVGDAAIVELSGKTERFGVEIGTRYQVADWLYVYADANFTQARSSDAPSGEDHIPLAPDFTSVGGFNVSTNKGLSGGLNYRYIGDRPANEDNSIVAEGYFVADANLSYSLGNLSFSVIVENLFDTTWNETQFATESRLFSETEPFEEIHFTPGTPFNLRGKISFRF